MGLCKFSCHAKSPEIISCGGSRNFIARPTVTKIKANEFDCIYDLLQSSVIRSLLDF